MSEGFQTNPAFAWEKNSYRAQLREDLIFEDSEIDRQGRPKIYVVPNRFYTDFASIPRFLWRLASPFDPEHRLPAVLHDYLYGLRGGEPYGLGRKECDELFLRAMKSEGQSWWKRHAIFNAVRTFGGIHSRAGGAWAK